MSALSRFFLGSPGGIEQVPTVNPQQQQFLEQLLGQLGGPLGMGIGNLTDILSGRPEAFASFEKPARQAFEQKTIPGIAERFSGVGGQQSSAFGQQLGQAASDLETNLSAQRSGLQSQALQQLMGLLGQGMQPQFQNYQQEAQPGFLQNLLSAIGSFGGTALTGGLAGLIGKQGFRSGASQAFGVR